MRSASSDDPAFWDRLARSYARQLWLERRAIRTGLGMLDPVGDMALLDVGTGTGEVLRQLARLPQPPQSVTGVDFSQAMLAQAPRIPDGWSLILADARNLPLPDDRFDGAVASYLLHLLPPSDIALTLNELRRVLRPGGRLVTVTPAVPPTGFPRVAAQASDLLARLRPGRLRPLRALDPRPALEQAGFEVVEVQWSTRGYPSLCVLSQTAAARADRQRSQEPLAQRSQRAAR